MVDFAKLVNDLLSASLNGQRRLFNQYLATNPEFKGVNPIAQSGLEQHFDPLSAQFLLRTGSGQDVGNFADYTKNAFGAVGQDNSLPQQLWNTRNLFWGQPLSPQDEARRKLLEDDPFGRQIIEQVYSTGLSPILRQYIPEIMQRQLAAAQARRPEASLFRQFAENNFNFPWV